MLFTRVFFGVWSVRSVYAAYTLYAVQIMMMKMIRIRDYFEMRYRTKNAIIQYYYVNLHFCSLQDVAVKSVAMRLQHNAYVSYILHLDAFKSSSLF